MKQRIRTLAGSHSYLYDLQANADASKVTARFYGGDPEGIPAAARTLLTEVGIIR